MQHDASEIERLRELLWIAERLAATTADPRDAVMYRAAARALLATASGATRDALRVPPATPPDLDARRLRAWCADHARITALDPELVVALDTYVATRASLGSARQLALFGML